MLEYRITSSADLKQKLLTADKNSKKIYNFLLVTSLRKLFSYYIGSYNTKIYISKNYPNELEIINTSRNSNLILLLCFKVVIVLFFYKI